MSDVFAHRRDGLLSHLEKAINVQAKLEIRPVCDTYEGLLSTTTGKWQGMTSAMCICIFVWYTNMHAVG